MRNELTETAKPDFANSVLDRLNTPIVRTCLLNLIAQIALGTPIAAEAPRNSLAAQICGQKETARARVDYRHSVARRAGHPRTYAVEITKP